LLFQPTAELARMSEGLGQAAPLVGTLVSDPSLRGLTRALSLGLIGVQNRTITLDMLARPMSMAAVTLEDAQAGRPASFSWLAMLSGQEPTPEDLRRFIEVHPVLDFSALEPGRKSSEAIRQAASDLELTSKYQARVRLTARYDGRRGIRHRCDGALVNTIGTVVIVLVILWLALKQHSSWRFITFRRLAITAALGLAMVGRLNMISCLRGVVCWPGSDLEFNIGLLQG
jgi:hypothetical protein